MSKCLGVNNLYQKSGIKGGSSQNGTAENVGEIATYTTTATDRF